MHQRPGSIKGFYVKLLSDSCIIFMRQRPGLKVTVISLPGLKDLVSSQGFNVGIQSNICTVFHSSKTWLQARVLMLSFCTTVISLPCIKDGTIKDLVSSQAFNIGIQSNI